MWRLKQIKASSGVTARWVLRGSARWVSRGGGVTAWAAATSSHIAFWRLHSRFGQRQSLSQSLASHSLSFLLALRFSFLFFFLLFFCLETGVFGAGFTFLNLRFFFFFLFLVFTCGLDGWVLRVSWPAGLMPMVYNKTSVTTKILNNFTKSNLSTNPHLGLSQIYNLF